MLSDLTFCDLRVYQIPNNHDCQFRITRKKNKEIIRKINLINLRFFLSPWQARKESESFLGLSVFVELLCVDIFAWVCFTRHLTQINGFRCSIVCLWPSESLSATM